jgi:tRNA pseudouridine38-40 synthase
LCHGRHIAVHGSGRTDAGVHARAQVAHADVPGRDVISPVRWRAALNAHLPPQIRVMRVQRAPAAFHARFDATGKSYRYRIWNGSVLPPREFGRAWHFFHPLDHEALREAVQRLIGTHDFASFSANRGHMPTSTIRTIERVDLTCRGRLLLLDYKGSGFLYKMVRLLTGSAVRCAQGRADLEWIDALLRREAKSSFAAPAEGLYLMRVHYDGPIR